jgi:hypothetical protein
VVATAAQVAARPWRFAVQPGGPAREDGAELVLTGAEREPFRHRGVRFLPLDTTRRTLDGGGLERLRRLRAALDLAARERDTGALAVVLRHTPDALDRKEAALLARLLAEFRHTTGKRAALITIGTPRSGAARSEGVLSVSAATSARTLVGVDAFAATGTDWLSVRQEITAGRE